MSRLLQAIVWAIILGVFTCTDNLNALLYHQAVHFKWGTHPDFSDLLITNDAHFTHPYWLFIKSGHLMGFAIMEMFLYALFRKPKPAVYVAFLFAVSTEILQLYFSRDGRLLDIGIDSAGIMLSCCLQLSTNLFKEQEVIK